ncbi:T-box transcription factor TBX20-like, partial [Penaeus vannamei]|uniref:T-box transcription factor TBX20-like n=1 Tax=Penaeus vannamei TaxID=6689 RepID=UPI00387F87ED
RMFPTVRVSFTGLKSEDRYIVLLDIVPIDNKRYRFRGSMRVPVDSANNEGRKHVALYGNPDIFYGMSEERLSVYMLNNYDILRSSHWYR